MSISVQQLKRILGSFSQIVAKDVSGIKTAYATKKDVEGFVKLSDLNNVYIKKGDIHTEDYVTNVIFRDAYQNHLVKKTDLPALDTIATKQEISNAVAAIQVPSIEGLAKESEVEAKLADYAKTAEVASTYATKEAVNAINGLDADTIATLKNLSEHSDLTAIANKVDNVYTKAETDDKLATKADVTAIPDISGLATKQEVTAAVAGITVPSIEGLAKTTDVDTKLADYAKKTELPSIEGLAKVTEVDTKLAAKADVSAIPDVSGLATKAEVAAVDAKFATKADASAIPSIEGLAKTTDVEATYAKKTELPDVSGLATKAEVEALKTDFVTEETLTQNINQFSTNVDGKINEAKGELEAKVTEVDGKLADYVKKTELPDVSGLATKAELPSIEGLAKTTEVVAKSVYDEKVQSLESEISALKAKLAAVASGTTEQRPTENLVVGQQYFDTTLGVPVYWNGTEWHNPFANITTVEVENH